MPNIYYLEFIHGWFKFGEFQAPVGTFVLKHNLKCENTKDPDVLDYVRI